jgi:hypothetical protein
MPWCLVFLVDLYFFSTSASFRFSSNVSVNVLSLTRVVLLPAKIILLGARSS